MKRIIQILWLLSVFSMVFAEEQLVELDKHRIDSLPANTTETYVLHIDKTYRDPQWNLFFIMEPINESIPVAKHMRVYTKKASGEVDIELTCDQLGIDSCFMNSAYIQDNQTLFVQVHCAELCLYDLTSYWSQSRPLLPDKPLVLDFEEYAYSKLFTLNISGATDFEQVQIILKAETFMKATSPIRLYASYGNSTPTPNNHQMQGLHLWNDGLGIFIDKENLQQSLITILVEGPAENILELTAHLRKSTENEIHMFESRFDELRPGQERTYFIDFQKSGIDKEDLQVKLSLYTGHIEAEFFSDKALTQLLFIDGFHHLGDSLYKFSKRHREEDNITTALYMRIKSSKVASTFVVSVNMKVENIIRLTGEIAEMSELDNEQLDNYYVNVVMDANNTSKIPVRFKIVQYSGEVELRFSVCKGETSTCATNFKSYTENKTLYEKLHPSHQIGTGSTSIFRVDLDPADFMDTSTDKYKSVSLAVYVANKVNGVSKYLIHYEDNSKVHVLRENHPIKERLEMGQYRFYKLPVFGEGVVAARVHLNEISGQTYIVAYNKDPREVDDPQNLPAPKTTEHNTLVFDKEHLNQPIYVIAYGQENSLYALTLSIERKSSISLEKHKPDIFNIITVPEHVEQELTLGELETVVVKLHPQEDLYQIITYSTMPLDYCGSFNLEKYPYEPNCEFKISERSVDINNTREVLIAIHNPHNKTVRTTIKYTNHYQCEEVKTGDVWKKEITISKGTKCVKYHLPRIEAIEIMITLSNSQYSTMKAIALINEAKVQLDSAYTLIGKREVANNCPENKGCDIIIAVEQTQATILHIVVQYTDKEITLLDGLSQPVYGSYAPSVYQYFKYHIEDKIETTVMLENKQGSFKFYVNILNDTDYKTGWSDMYPTAGAHNYKSDGHYYSPYHHLIITAEMFKNHTCTKCIALIAVGVEGDSMVPQGNFIIEVSQEVRHLKEHKSTVGYLQKDTVAYYDYYSPKENGSLFITLTTQNHNCATIYLAKGEHVRASGVNYIQKSVGNDLFYNSEKGLYDITVEAHSNCAYTISASSSPYRIYELSSGVYKDIKVEKDEYAYFFYHHLTNTGFKVLSMEQYGQVMIFANESSYGVLEEFEKQTSINLTAFSWHDQHDVLEVLPTDKGFCSMCYYMIVVKPVKKTETSLIISNGLVDVPLSTRKQIKDTLKPGESIYYKLFESKSELDFTIDVFFGELQVTVFGNDKNETKTFKSDKKPQKFVFKHNDVQERFMFKPIRIHVKAVVASLYKLSVKGEGSNFRTVKLKKGVPSYLFVPTHESSCVLGSIEDKAQRFMVTVHQKEKDKLKAINVSAKLGDKVVTNLRKDIVENTMAVSFDLNSYSINESINFTLCFESKDPVELTIVPTATLQLLIEGTSLLVHSSQNLTFVPEGKFVVEAFECQGITNVHLTSKYDALAGSESDLLNFKRFGQNSLFEAQSYAPAFMNIDGRSTLVRWFHINEQNGEGIAYHTFRVAHQSYQFVKKQLVIKVPQLLKNENKTSQVFTIDHVNYTVFLGDDQLNLKKTVQCNIGNLYSKTLTVNGTGDLTTDLVFSFPFDDINKEFSNSPYIWTSVVAIIEVKTKTNKTEIYKFIYDEEEIPWKESVNVEIVTVVQKNNWNVPIAILSACLGVLLIICVVRYVIMKIRTRPTFVDMPQELEVRDTDRDLS